MLITKDLRRRKFTGGADVPQKCPLVGIANGKAFVVVPIVADRREAPTNIGEQRVSSQFKRRLLA